jgi:hypothetical protein
MSKSQKALVANDLLTGKLCVEHLTGAQACALASVSVGYVHTASRLVNSERAAIRHGYLKLSGFHNKPKRPRDEVQALDKIIARYGIAAVFGAVERATAPGPAQAAE